ncbi:MAG TPA: family 10 glycosylhydrolase [Chitinophagaceae bacterium]|nr:family 10 glycosylhydrolase [Chitinophagaceae bacterium]
MNNVISRPKIRLKGMHYRIVSLLAGFLLLASFSFAQPKAEFRGVWVATVDNIDWPLRGDYNSNNQKAAFINLLDMHQRNGMNAIIMQIRPAADAFYPSPYEPWSEWLTGKQGRPPVPYYDPLQFMIEETHKRGMEFHAWCNPYRAEFSIGKSSIAPTHITRIHPEWFLPYGTVRLFDPGNKEAQQYVVQVIRDIVRRYPIDAIHFDDYFYPYRIAGKEFPDTASFRKYGNGMNKDDWRRSNTDSIILALSKAIKEENQYCRFGISPFGVWRNADKDSMGSNTKAGQTNYDDLYADILLWLREGWIDYVAPQLYWEFEHAHAPYGPLLDWWNKHTYGKHCYIGLGIFRAGSNANWRQKDELTRMIREMRNMPNIQGAIYFSSKSFDRNPNGWNDSLRNNYYRYPAIVPPMPWIDSSIIEKPVLSISSTGPGAYGTTLHLQAKESTKEIKSFIVYNFEMGDAILNKNDPKNIVKVIPALRDTMDYVIPQAADKMKRFAVSCIDFENNESELSIWPPL